MTQKNKYWFLMLGLLAGAAQADEASVRCLFGTWVAVEEAIVPLDEAGAQAMSIQVDVLSGGVRIEILDSGAVHVSYDGYELLMTMSTSGRTNTHKARFSGDTEGRLGGSVEEQKLSMGGFSDVDIEVSRLMPDGQWIFIGADQETPPHSESYYGFECSDSELILTKARHDEYGGAAYRGRFVRDN